MPETDKPTGARSERTGDAAQPTPTKKEAEVANKAIILVTGSETEDLYAGNVAAAGAAPKLGLLPKAAVPPGAMHNPNVNMWAAPPSAAPFATMSTTYSSVTFGNAGWWFRAARIHNLGDVNTLLAKASQLNPAGVVLHYVGHGSSDNRAPLWSCRGTRRLNVTWTAPDGTMLKGILNVPVDGDVANEIPVSDVVDAMELIFPRIPLTLITDACDNQPVLGMAVANLRTIVMDKVMDKVGRPRVVNEGQFTTAWSTVASPSCFAPDDKPSGRRAALGTVNKAMAAMPAPTGAGPQVAACRPA